MKALDVAKYFLSKDKEEKLFNMELVENNGRIFYEGNARLNKYLFLSQVVHLAKYEELLFDDDFLAYENGPIIKEIMNDYAIILRQSYDFNISEEKKVFLDKIYDALENATCEELIEISHEDPEWIELQNKTYNGPHMNLKNHIKEYKIRYKGLIEALKI